jgi:hypothetical protein
MKDCKLHESFTFYFSSFLILCTHFQPYALYTHTFREICSRTERCEITFRLRVSVSTFGQSALPSSYFSLLVSRSAFPLSVSILARACLAQVCVSDE